MPSLFFIPDVCPLFFRRSFFITPSLFFVSTSFFYIYTLFFCRDGLFFPALLRALFLPSFFLLFWYALHFCLGFRECCPLFALFFYFFQRSPPSFCARLQPGVQPGDLQIPGGSTRGFAHPRVQPNRGFANPRVGLGIFTHKSPKNCDFCPRKKYYIKFQRFCKGAQKN